jgi:hypothetical protein
MRFLNQRRRVLSPEETAANAARKQARENASMACQCCGRRILAKRGLIAHHGYTRPGQGWQTASCMGAGYVPFAFGRDRLWPLRTKPWPSPSLSLTTASPGSMVVPARPRLWMSPARTSKLSGPSMHFRSVLFRHMTSMVSRTGRYMA